MARNFVNQPSNSSFKVGETLAKLTWGGGFANKYNGQFSAAQKFVDSECLRRCSPRVPKREGYLENSGKLGTVIGSGELKYTMPYSAKQYYDTADTRPYDADRGAHWFERMKVADKADILEGAKKIAGGG